MENQELTKQQSQALVSGRPGRGFESGVDKEDILIPRAKLIQFLSPEVTEGKAQAGQIINSISAEILPVEFVPFYMFKSWIKFNPKDKQSPDFDPNFEPGDVLWVTNDRTDPRTEEARFGKNGEKPKAIMFMNFLAFFPEIQAPIMISFGKTSYMTGKQLFNMTLFPTGQDMFAKKYALKSKKTSNGEFTYYVFAVEKMGKSKDEDFKTCEALHEQFKGMESAMKIHDLKGDSEAGTEGSGETPF